MNRFQSAPTTSQRQAPTHTKGPRQVHPAEPVEPEITWADYSRIEPGEYFAYCRSSRVYYSGVYHKWVCLLRFDVLAPDRMTRLTRAPMFLSLGRRAKPFISRCGNYWSAWIHANGGGPHRHDRMSPLVFRRRMARVMVRDTNGPMPYSVVAKILLWETGGRLAVLPVVPPGFEERTVQPPGPDKPNRVNKALRKAEREVRLDREWFDRNPHVASATYKPRDSKVSAPVKGPKAGS